MASANVAATVEAYLKANWTQTPIKDINLEGEPPADGSPYLTVQYPTATETFVGMAEIGQRTFRESGSIRCVLSVPRRNGRMAALTLCDQLRALLRSKPLGNNVVCREASPPIENDANDVGVFYVLSFIVPYYFDLIA